MALPNHIVRIQYHRQKYKCGIYFLKTGNTAGENVDGFGGYTDNYEHPFFEITSSIKTGSVSIDLRSYF